LNEDLAEEIEELTERFGAKASVILKAGAKYENVSPEAMSVMTSAMLLAYLFMRGGLHNSAQEKH